LSRQHCLDNEYGAAMLDKILDELQMLAEGLIAEPHGKPRH
jgi:hypothetical protein